MATGGKAIPPAFSVETASLLGRRLKGEICFEAASSAALALAGGAPDFGPLEGRRAYEKAGIRSSTWNGAKS